MLRPEFGHELWPLGLTLNAEYFLGHLFNMKGLEETIRLQKCLHTILGYMGCSLCCALGLKNSKASNFLLKNI